MINEPNKTCEPEHIGHARSVAADLMDTYNYVEQNEVVKAIRDTLVEKRHLKSQELKKEAEHIDSTLAGL